MRTIRKQPPQALVDAHVRANMAGNFTEAARIAAEIRADRFDVLPPDGPDAIRIDTDDPVVVARAKRDQWAANAWKTTDAGRLDAADTPLTERLRAMLGDDTISDDEVTALRAAYGGPGVDLLPAVLAGPHEARRILRMVRERRAPVRP
jgi:hypothetical protein